MKNFVSREEDNVRFRPPKIETTLEIKEARFMPSYVIKVMYYKFYDLEITGTQSVILGTRSVVRMHPLVVNVNPRRRTGSSHPG